MFNTEVIKMKKNSPYCYQPLQFYKECSHQLHSFTMNRYLNRVLQRFKAEIIDVVYVGIKLRHSVF